MSNLLERAIIDAKALKDAALKNAEQLVIEKYSHEVREAVNRLIEEDILEEQEDPALDMGMDMGLGGMEDVAPAPDMNNQEGDPEQSGLDSDSLLADFPDAFLADEDEVIRIKLDSLEAEFEDEEEDGPFAGKDKMGEDEIGISIEDEDENEDEELDFEDLEDDDDDDGDIEIDITQDVVSEVLEELDIDEEEIDLDELMERVRVDFEPQKSGWAGTPESKMREYEAMLLAKEQDSDTKEENEELRKAVAALQKENKTLSSAASKLQEQNNNYETTFEALQEKLETMNVSNAKLLYINQALENASLNERQKRKIVEAISKAETVQEAKIMFETLNDTVATTSDVKKDSTLSEMVSRKSSLLVAARNEQPKKDANPLFNRMQMLAGIKANKS
tara:strand:- start:419 stop:1591 length:1173 start_codon:yes stop_codon:yes gene_type:complete